VKVNFAESVDISLSKAEALVLFEFLGRSSESNRNRPNETEPALHSPDSAEWRALWNLECLLEKTLTEIFSPDYARIIEDARRRLTDPE
jgi:hypothetical protein